MSTTEKKKKIINLVEQTTDETWLNHILETASVPDQTDDIYQLSEFELEKIKAGQKDFEDGNVISHEDLKIKTREWLEKLAGR